MGLLSTVVLAGFQPRRTAQKAKDAALWQVYLVHWVGLLFGACLLLVAGSCDPQFLRELDYIERELRLHPASAGIGLFVVAGIESFFLLVALMVTPWVSANARLRQAWSHALRTVWLHTGQLMLSLFPFAAVAFYGNGHLVWYQRARIYHDPLAPSAVLQFLADYYQYALPIVCAAGIVWCIWALLRAATADMSWPAPDRPPLCETCGYNLTYHKQEGARCPECGQPASIWFNPEHRLPVAWWPFQTKYVRVGFWQATWRAWFSPELFFARLSAYSGLKEAGTFLLVHMLLAAAAFAVGFAVPMRVLIFNNENGFGEFCYAIIWVGTFLGLAAGGLSCLVAAIYGLFISREDGFNKMGICLRSACYCSGIYSLWLSTTMASLVICMEMVNRMRSLGRYEWMVLGLHVLYLVICVGGVVRRVRYIRYANY